MSEIEVEIIPPESREHDGDPWTASSLYRRIVCTGSGEAERGLPDVPEAGDWAQTGTLIHKAAVDLEKIELLDDERDRDMARDQHALYAQLRLWALDNGGRYEFEYPTLVKDRTGRRILKGRMDMFAFVGKLGVVWDLKTGWGPPAFGFWICQGRVYAIGLMQEFEQLERVSVRFHRGQIGHTYEFTIERHEIPGILREWRRVYRRRYYQKMTLTPDAGACRFCKVRPTCPALRAMIHKLPEELAEVPLLELPAPALNSVYRQALVAEQAVKAVRAVVRTRARKGEEALDWEIDMRQGNREIRSPTALWDALKIYGTPQEVFYAGVKVQPGIAATAWAKANKGRVCPACCYEGGDPRPGVKDCRVCLKGKGKLTSVAAGERAFWWIARSLVSRADDKEYLVEKER